MTKELKKKPYSYIVTLVIIISTSFNACLNAQGVTNTNKKEKAADFSKPIHELVEMEYIHLNSESSMEEIVATLMVSGRFYPFIILRAVNLLGDIGTDRAVSALFEALSRNRTNKNIIIRALGRTDNVNAIDPLLELLREAIVHNKRRDNIESSVKKPKYKELTFFMAALSRLLDTNDTRSNEFIEILNESINDYQKEFHSFHKEKGLSRNGVKNKNPTNEELNSAFVSSPIYLKRKMFLLRVEKGKEYKKYIEAILLKQYPELILNHKIEKMTDIEQWLLFIILEEIKDESSDMKKVINSFVVLEINDRVPHAQWSSAPSTLYKRSRFEGERQYFNSDDEYSDMLGGYLCNDDSINNWIMDRIKASKNKQLISKLEMKIRSINAHKQR